MQSFSLLAPGKINLYLEIVGHRLDGFHELIMILQSIELADQIDIKASGNQKISLYCDHPQVPLDETNLAYKAANLMREVFPDVYANFGGVDLRIIKNLPVAAGLAGGSADAAAVLAGVNLLWNLGLSQLELQELAAELGSDIPFCLNGGTAIATGRGEKLDEIGCLDNLWVVLAKSKNIGVSTPWAYKTYRQKYGDSYMDSNGFKNKRDLISGGSLVKAITQKDSSRIGSLLHNDLEKVVLPDYPQVARLKTEFSKIETLGTMMSGSGPTVFALFETKAQAEEAARQVQTQSDSDVEFWVTKLASRGIQVI